jgi:hypothetical protein
MRKTASVILVMLALTGVAQAQHYGPHRHHQGYHWHPHYGWVLPTIVGGVIGYEIARSQQPPVIVQQPPVIVQQQPQSAIQTQTCTPWIERQEADGRITRTRTCTQ